MRVGEAAAARGADKLVSARYVTPSRGGDGDRASRGYPGNLVGLPTPSTLILPKLAFVFDRQSNSLTS